jgi:hypothetical protein
MRLVTRVLTAVLVLSTATLSIADEAPIVGKIKAVDATAQTLTVTSVAKGQTREVVIDVKPGTKIVRFARGSEPGKTAVTEQSAALVDLKPGWTVSVVTRHDGPREVAEQVRVVFEQ